MPELKNQNLFHPSFWGKNWDDGIFFEKKNKTIDENDCS